MGEVVEFYVPGKFKPKRKYVPVNLRGKLMPWPAKPETKAEPKVDPAEAISWAPHWTE